MRKRSKFLAFLTAAAASSVILTGCKSAKPRNFEEERVDMGPVYYNGSTETETFLTGFDGRKIKASEIDYLLEKTGRNKKDLKQTNILNEKSFCHAECDGFAYGFVPGVYYDKENDPDKFGGDFYIGEKTGESKEFIRINVGDKFGELTVKSATTYFGAWIEDGADFTGCDGSELEFDGEITLTGILDIPPQNPAYPGMILDMTFQSGLENGLPLSLGFFRESGLEPTHYPLDGYNVYTDVPEISLGKFTDYGIYFDGLDEGDSARVELTVTNVKLHGRGRGFQPAPAEIVNVKRL